MHVLFGILAKRVLCRNDAVSVADEDANFDEDASI